MSYQNIFKRYELKYLITKEQQKDLYEVMKKYMLPDKFGKSTITNVYFDTPDKLLIRRSLEKPFYKEKLRIRSYGRATEESTVFVEIKKKYDGVVYKRRLNLSEHLAEEYLIKHHAIPESSQIAKEINYFIFLYGELEPSAYLSYDREAFFCITDDNFRMTFDENILTRDYDLSLMGGVYGTNILPSGLVLLEVKTALGMPRWLLDFFGENKIYKTSFSKYGKAYSEVMLPKFLEEANYVS